MLLRSLRANEDEEYNYDVEDFLLRLIFNNLYSFGSYVSYCLPYKDCDTCTKCPDVGYKTFADKVNDLLALGSDCISI